MRPYQLKSAQKQLNGEPLEGYAVFCDKEERVFVNAFEHDWARDFVNHLNDAFDIFEFYMKAKNETIG